MSYFILHLRSADKARIPGQSTLAASGWTGMRSIDVEVIVGNLGEPLRDDEEDREAPSGMWDSEMSYHDDPLGLSPARSFFDDDNYV